MQSTSFACGRSQVQSPDILNQRFSGGRYWTAAASQRSWYWSRRVNCLTLSRRRLHILYCLLSYTARSVLYYLLVQQTLQNVLFDTDLGYRSSNYVFVLDKNKLCTRGGQKVDWDLPVDLVMGHSRSLETACSEATASSHCPQPCLGFYLVTSPPPVSYRVWWYNPWFILLPASTPM